jgi:hypothetical protein
MEISVNVENIDVLIINEANVTNKNITLYNINSYTIYALYKSQQFASGILAAVKPLLHQNSAKLRKLMKLTQ